MKKIFFPLLLVLSGIGMAQEKAELTVSIDIANKNNQPYFAYNHEVSKILLEAAMSGKLAAFHPSTNQPMTLSEIHKKLTIPQEDPDYIFDADIQPRMFFPSELSLLKLSRSLDRNATKENTDESAWEKITLCFPATHYSVYTGEDEPVVSFPFEKAVEVLNDYSFLYYHPENNADSLKLGEALSQNRFAVSQIFYKDSLSFKFASFSWKDGYLNEDYSPEFSPEENKLFAKPLHDLFPGFISSLDPSYRVPLKISGNEPVRKFTVEETFFTTDTLNSSYGMEGKELSSIILDACDKGMIRVYKNDSLTTRLTMEEFQENKRMVPVEKFYYYDDYLDKEVAVFQPDPNDPSNFFQGRDLYQVVVSKELICKGEQIIKERIQAITLCVPYNHPSNMKGITMWVGSFAPQDVDELLRYEKAMWYNPLNHADSMLMADALKKSRYRISYLHAKDIFGNTAASFGFNENLKWADFAVGYGSDSLGIIPAKILNDSFPDKEFQRTFKALSSYHNHFLDPEKVSCFSIPKTVKNTYFKCKLYRQMDCGSVELKDKTFEEFIEEFLKANVSKKDTLTNLVIGSIFNYNGPNPYFPIVIIEEEVALTNNKPVYRPSNLIIMSKDSSTGGAIFLKVKFSEIIKALGNDKAAKLLVKRKYLAEPMVVLDVAGKEAYAVYLKTPMVNRRIAYELVKDYL